jgi:hypothetical protein
VLFSSCSKSNKEGRYIPKNAAMVVLVDGESISKKLPWDDVKQNALFKQLYQDSTLDAFVKNALDNPENTGIDTKKDFLFFVQKDSIGGYVAMEGSITDKEKFKKFNAEATKSAQATEKNGIQFMGNDKVMSSWKDDRFITVIDMPQLNDINKFSNSFGDNNNPAPVANRNEQGICTQLHDLKEAVSLGKESRFTDLVKQKGDIHFWLNVGEISTGSTGMAALSMLNLSKLYEGSITTASASFDDGKITVDAKSYAGKEMSDLWKKYSGNKVNTDMMKRFNGKDVAVLVAMNFKPEGLREFVKMAGLDGFINMGSAYLGFNLDDFVKANNGDILLAISDINTKGGTMGNPDVNAIFAASVNDKKAFGKLIDAGNKLGKNSMGNNQVFYNTNDKFFAIGSKKESVNKFVLESGSNKMDFLDQISGSPVAAFVNFQTLFNAGKDEVAKDSLDNILFQASVKMWDNIVAKGGDFIDGGSTQHIEVNLVDKKTSSLKQLNQYLGKVGEVMKAKEEKRKHEMAAYFSDEEPVVTEDATVSPN